MTSMTYGSFRLDLLDDIDARTERLTLQPPVPTRPRKRRGPAPATPLPRGREQQVADAVNALRAGVPVEFDGPCGIGKSMLLRHLADAAYPNLGVPGIYLQVAPDEKSGDLLQRLIRDLYVTDRPVRPTPSECAQLLAHARPVVVLDGVTWDPDQLAYLLRVLPGCALVIGSERPSLGPRGMSPLLPGLAQDAAGVLVSQDLGRPLTGDELPAVRRLVVAVEGQPLRLRQAASLVQAGEQSFAALADAAARDQAALNRLSLNHLSGSHGQVLTALALLGGAFLPVDLIDIISNTGQVIESLADLRDRDLVEQRDDRFGLPTCQAEGHRELIFLNIDLAAAIRDIADWLGQRDPGSEASLSLVNAVVSLTGFAAKRGEWDGVVHLIRVAEPILTLAGRWESCRQILDIGIRAANTIGNTTAEALFHHNKAPRALPRPDPDRAVSPVPGVGPAPRTRRRSRGCYHPAQPAPARRRADGTHPTAYATRPSGSEPPPPPGRRVDRGAGHRRRRRTRKPDQFCTGLATQLDGEHRAAVAGRPACPAWMPIFIGVKGHGQLKFYSQYAER
jgi:hypothetical protein